MRLKANSSHCSFHLSCEYFVGLTEGFVWLAGASRLPNSSAEGMAQHFFFFICLLIYFLKGVFTETWEIVF